MVGEFLQVILLLRNFLLHFFELLLLALTDGKFLAGPLTPLECVSVTGVGQRGVSSNAILASNGGQEATRNALGELRDATNWTYPAPPVLGGAPVSPSAMTRAVVVKVAREARRRGCRAAVLTTEVRIIAVSDNYGCLEEYGVSMRKWLEVEAVVTQYSVYMYIYLRYELPCSQRAVTKPVKFQSSLWPIIGCHGPLPHFVSVASGTISGHLFQAPTSSRSRHKSHALSRFFHHVKVSLL